jgi:hypothetical protein
MPKVKPATPLPSELAEHSREPLKLRLDSLPGLSVSEVLTMRTER